MIDLRLEIPVCLLFGTLFLLMAARDLNKEKRCSALFLGSVATVFLLMGFLSLGFEFVVLQAHNHHYHRALWMLSLLQASLKPCGLIMGVCFIVGTGALIHAGRQQQRLRHRASRQSPEQARNETEAWPPAPKVSPRG